MKFSNQSFEQTYFVKEFKNKLNLLWFRNKSIEIYLDKMNTEGKLF